MVTFLLILGSLLAGQVDESRIITLNLAREHVASVQARAYRPGRFSVAVRLNAPCAEVLADLTRANTGRHFRLNVGGEEVLFAQVHVEITGGDIEIQRQSRRAAEALAAHLQPVPKPSAVTRPGTARADCSHWEAGG